MAQPRDTLAPPGDGDYAELRNLLLAPEQSRLEQLQEQVEHIDLNAHNVSRLLPDAIALRGEHDQRLTRVLTPHVSEALGTSVRKQPQMIVDAIAPIMMPAIRQSIANALRSMVQSLNQTIEHSLSLRSMQWRLEALRTGKPFAEIVLLHTLCYRVEQVFLIHSQTGLLLAHAAGDSVAVQDQTLVSGMLSAIRTFVQDSFGAAPDQALNTLQVGELTVWIEQGPAAILAAVIRGTPPEQFHIHLQDTLTRIHAEQADAFDRFEGDASIFSGMTPLLEDCLQAQFEPRRRAVSPMTWVVLATLLLGAAWWGASLYQERQQWRTYVTRLGAEPGLVLTATEAEGRQYRLAGLRDPLAADPEALLRDSGLDPQKVTAQWSPYYALDPAFLLTRARHILAPPHTVRLAVDGTRLIAAGTAPTSWIRESRSLARLLPGLDHYDDQPVMSQSLDEAARQLTETSILFEQGRGDIRSPEQRHSLSGTMDILHRIDELARLSGATLTIRIIGRTDIVGGAAQNRRLSEGRAHSVLAAIHPETHPSITFEAHGVTLPSEAQGARAATALSEDRRVSFQVTVHPAP